MLKINTRIGDMLKLLSVFILLGFLTACVSTSDPRSNVTNRPVTDKAMVHTKLAQSYLQQKQYATAKEELAKALKINPKHSESNYVMALLMLELQQYEATEEHFKKAIKYDDGTNSAAAHDFGTYLCQTGREREAVKYFEIAASNPLFDQPHLSYMRAGECLSNINDLNAEKYLQRSLTIDPRLGPALFQLAKIKYANDENLSARAYIQRFIAINKKQPAALLLAYKIESALNANEYANEYRSQLLENFPASIEARTVRNQMPADRE